MASLLENFATAVGKLAEQPVDELNYSYATGAPVSTRQPIVLLRDERAPRGEFPVYPKDDADEKKADARAEFVEDEADVRFTVQMENPDSWKGVMRKRAMQRDHVVYPQNSILDRFEASEGEMFELEEWWELREMHDAVGVFLALATSTTPALEDAQKYVKGQIGQRITVEADLVVEDRQASWDRERTVVATHTGSMGFIDTLHANGPAGKLRAWLKMAVGEYQLLAKYTPVRDVHVLGYFEIYYTATTLAHLYALSVTLSGVAMGVSREKENAPIAEMLSAVVQEELDSSHKVITIKLDDDGNVQGSSMPEDDAQPQSEERLMVWEKIFSVNLPYRHARSPASTGPATDLLRFCVWSDTYKGDATAKQHEVIVPESAGAMDLHVRATVTSPYDPHRELKGAIPLDEASIATGCPPVRVPLSPFDLLFTDTSVAAGKVVTEYKIQEMTLINTDYQFIAHAWASMSHIIPGDSETQSIKRVRFMDFCMHVEEGVLALFMAQSLAALAREHRVGKDESAEDDADYKTLIARAVLFQNLCE